ncbi:hypothetical protein OGZ51_07265 [Lactococcus lactis]|uniref:Uncharacterized protein n=1 Tax=Lactococcus lactis TaxID=1358 RepID=A0A9X4NH15_9LACT|nr:hypothetical protein [Lactococcus lactis]MDG4983940.1 hypothetical protein [Lactococcus lactis]
MFKQKIDKIINQIKAQSTLRVSKNYNWSQYFEFRGDIPVEEQKLEQPQLVYELMLSDKVYLVTEQFALWYQGKITVTEEELITLFKESKLIENS